MITDPKQTTDEPGEKVYLDYIPVDVVQRILTYPARRAAKLAELAAEDAALSVNAAAQEVEVIGKQKGRWEKAGCDVFNAQDVLAFIKTKNLPSSL